MSDQPSRGRGRSSSFLEEADEDSSGSSPSSSPSGAPKPPKAKKKGTQLSKKTLNIVTNLHGQQQQTSRSSDSSSAAKAAEEALEAEERQRELAKEAEKAKPKKPHKAKSKKGGSKGGSKGGKGGSEKESYDHYIKILLLGDSGVGKTSVMLRYADDDFQADLLSTAGVDYKVHFMDVDGLRIKCQIWDTAGQERFHVITRAYYRGAQGIALVYDVADEESLKHVDYWMENIEKHASKDVQTALLGNKIDLPDRCISTEQGNEVAQRHGVELFETSAKDGTNVRGAFDAIARSIVKVLEAKKQADAAARKANEDQLKSGGASRAPVRGGSQKGINMGGVKPQAGKNKCAIL